MAQFMVTFECTGQVYLKDQIVHSERSQIPHLEVRREGDQGKMDISWF